MQACRLGISDSDAAEKPAKAELDAKEQPKLITVMRGLFER